MSKDCTYEYFDSNGQTSELYNKIKATQGDAAAHVAFLNNALLDTAPVKHSVTIDGESRLANFPTYDELKAKGSRKVTSVLDENVDKKAKEKMLNRMALNLYVRDAFTAAEKSGLKMSYAEIEAVAKEKFGFKEGVATTELQEFDLLKNDAESLSKFGKTRGDVIHHYLDSVFKVMDELTMPGDSNYSFGKLVAEAYNRYKKEYKDEEYLLTEVIRTNLNNIVTSLIAKKNELNKLHGTTDFKFASEAEVYSDRISLDGQLLHGKIDLMIYSPSKKIVHLIDYKTKTSAAITNYDRVYEQLGGKFSAIRHSGHNEASVQIETYALILEKDYGFTVEKSEIYLLDSNIVADESTPVGNRKWKLSAINHMNSERRAAAPLSGILSSIYEIKDDDNALTDTSKLVQDLFDNKLELSINSKQNYLNREKVAIKQSEDGTFYWINKSNPAKSVYKKKTKEEVVTEIDKAYDEFVASKAFIASDLAAHFEGTDFSNNSVWNTVGYRQHAFHILAPYDRKKHTILTHQQVKGLDKDVILIVDNVTKETHIISLAPIFNSDHKFNTEDNEDGKSTIFGTMMSDNAVAKKYGKGAIPKATSANMNNLRLALIAAKLRKQNPHKFKMITNIATYTLLDKIPYHQTTMKAQLGYLSQFKTVLTENNSPYASELSSIFDLDILEPEKTGKLDYLQEFINSVMAEEDPMSQLRSQNPKFVDKKAKFAGEELKGLFKKYNEDRNNLEVNEKLEKQLMYYVQNIYASLLNKHTTNVENIYSDAVFVAANRAWLAFKGWLSLEHSTYKNMYILGSANSLTSAGDTSAENLHLAITQYEQRARDEVVEDSNEHFRLQTALIKASPDVSIIGSKITSGNYKKLFAPMLKDGYSFDKDNVQNWMVFKDPDDPKSDLTPIQKEYIRFYAKLVKKYSNNLFKGNYNIMYPGSNADDFTKTKWSDYSIPIIRGDEMEASNDASFSVGRSQQGLKSLGNTFKNAGKAKMKENENSVSPWDYESVFPAQVDSGQGRGSVHTRSLLNITDSNEVIEESRTIEMNPVTILNTMMVEAARKEHMRVAAFASFSIQSELAYKKLFPGEEAKNEQLRKICADISMIKIHGKVKDQGKVGTVADSIKYGTQVATYALSMRRPVTEISTAIFQVFTQGMANVINKHLLGGKNKYDNKDMVWAMSKINDTWASQVMGDLGLFNASLGQYAFDEFDALKKGYLFKSENAYAGAKTIMEKSTQNMMMAQFHKEGITEKCYTLNEKSGRYEYDETKDDRFYVYDKENPIPNQKPKAPQTEDEIKKYKFWLTHVNMLRNEGGLTKEGRMKRPLINSQIQAIKNYSIRIVGAMDNTETMAMEADAVGRLMVGHRRYLQAKVVNYFKSSKNNTFRNQEWVYTRGEWELQQAQFVSLVDSFLNVSKGLINGAKLSELSDHEKRQASRLLADMLIGTIMMVLLMKMKDLIADSVLKDEVIAGLLNGASDINPITTFVNTLDGNAMPAVSIAVKFARNSLLAMGTIVTGDFEKAQAATDKAMQSFGGYRTGKVFVDALIGLDENK
jgi:hypothetical protein